MLLVDWILFWICVAVVVFAVIVFALPSRRKNEGHD